jgi:hypothetical protein
LSEKEIKQIAEFCNEMHDSGSVHATYWKRIQHVKNAMLFYCGKKGTHRWKEIASEEFVSFLFF